jgi:hypothetical protein
VDDQTLLERISQLVAEEQTLQEEPHHDQKRLAEVEVMLDQCWDLLRQRRARREFGLDPEAAEPRDPSTVERYVQ